MNSSTAKGPVSDAVAVSSCTRSAVAVEASGGVTPGLRPSPKGIFTRMRFWTGSTMPLS